MTGEQDLSKEIRRLERTLAARDPDGVDGGLMSLIADDFVEFGRSGRTWTRESIRVELEGSSNGLVEMDGFEVHELAVGVILATYRSGGANRSSIWVRRDGRWQIRFHQGTPTARG